MPKKIKKRDAQARGDFPHIAGRSHPGLNQALSLAAEAKILSELFRKGRFAETEERSRRLLDRHPGWVDGWNMLGACCGALKKHEDAAFSFRRVLELKPGYAPAHLNLGLALSSLGRLTEAIERFRSALSLQPDYAVVYNNLGLAYQDLGMMPEARSSFEQAMRIKPAYTEAVKNYTESRRFSEGDHELVYRLEKMARKVELDEDRGNLHFSLGKIYNDMGKYDDAFLHFNQGNKVERKKYQYNWHDFSDYIDHLRRVFPADFIGARTGAGSSSELPVFIVGMPRSGTTLIEQIISSHPLAFGAGELTFLHDMSQRLAAEQAIFYPECMKALASERCNNAASEYIGFLRGFNRDAVRITDKMPSNFLHLGLIALLFPKARIVHCRRGAEDTCLSIYFHKFRNSHAYAYDLEELGHFYRDYAVMMDHWRTVLPTGMLFEIQYEDLVERPEEMSRKLMGFCGLEWDEQCLNAHENERSVRTASSWQVRQPIYKTSRERWRRYEKHLAPLLAALAGAQDW